MLLVTYWSIWVLYPVKKEDKETNLVDVGYDDVGGCHKQMVQIRSCLCVIHSCSSWLVSNLHMVSSCLVHLVPVTTQKNSSSMVCCCQGCVALWSSRYGSQKRHTTCCSQLGYYLQLISAIISQFQLHISLNFCNSSSFQLQLQNTWTLIPPLHQQSCCSWHPRHWYQLHSWDLQPHVWLLFHTCFSYTIQYWVVHVLKLMWCCQLASLRLENLGLWTPDDYCVVTSRQVSI